MKRQGIGISLLLIIVLFSFVFPGCGDNYAEEELEQLQHEIDELKIEIAQLQAGTDKEELEQLQHEIDKLKIEIALLQAGADKEELEQLQYEIDELKIEIAQLQAGIDDGNGNEPGLYTVIEVIDGDTIELPDEVRIRYIGINTPEKGNKFWYDKATEANRLLVEGKKVTLEFDADEIDDNNNNRILAYVFVGDIFVNLELVRMGYALAYPVRPNVKYQDKFARTEAAAIHDEIGMWKRVDSDIKIVEVNAVDEWVTIVNNGIAAVNMADYTLNDRANHVYTFVGVQQSGANNDFILPAGDTVKVFTGKGEDDKANLYWGSGRPIWNNDGDAAFLFNAKGEFIDYLSFPK